MSAAQLLVLDFLAGELLVQALYRTQDGPEVQKRKPPAAQVRVYYVLVRTYLIVLYTTHTQRGVETCQRKSQGTPRELARMRKLQAGAPVHVNTQVNVLRG